MSIKILLTLAGIEPATFRFVAQHLNHCATAVPNVRYQCLCNPYDMTVKVKEAHLKYHRPCTNNAAQYTNVFLNVNIPEYILQETKTMFKRNITL